MWNQEYVETKLMKIETNQLQIQQHKKVKIF